MKFQHYDLGYRQSGETVKVTLSGNAANVQLMDSSTFHLQMPMMTMSASTTYSFHMLPKIRMQ